MTTLLTCPQCKNYGEFELDSNHHLKRVLVCQGCQCKVNRDTNEKITEYLLVWGKLKGKHTSLTVRDSAWNAPFAYEPDEVYEIRRVDE